MQYYLHYPQVYFLGQYIDDDHRKFRHEDSVIVEDSYDYVVVPGSGYSDSGGSDSSGGRSWVKVGDRFLFVFSFSLCSRHLS